MGGGGEWAITLIHWLNECWYEQMWHAWVIINKKETSHSAGSCTITSFEFSTVLLYCLLTKSKYAGLLCYLTHNLGRKRFMPFPEVVAWKCTTSAKIQSGHADCTFNFKNQQDENIIIDITTLLINVHFGDIKSTLQRSPNEEESCWKR